MRQLRCLSSDDRSSRTSRTLLPLLQGIVPCNRVLHRRTRIRNDLRTCIQLVTPSVFSDFPYTGCNLNSQQGLILSLYGIPPPSDGNKARSCGTYAEIEQDECPGVSRICTSMSPTLIMSPSHTVSPFNPSVQSSSIIGVHVIHSHSGSHIAGEIIDSVDGARVR